MSGARPALLLVGASLPGDAREQRWRSHGLNPLTQPVSLIRPLPLSAPPSGPFVAGCVSSVHAVQAALLIHQPSLAALPWFTTGERTAAAAASIGLTVRQGQQGLASLLPLVQAACPGGGRVLHPGGRPRMAEADAAFAAAGLPLVPWPLYEAVPVATLRPAVAQALATAPLAGCCLYSARSARLFGMLVQRANLTARLHSLPAFCLSAAVAEAAQGVGFQEIQVAPASQERDLVALTLRRCCPTTPQILAMGAAGPLPSLAHSRPQDGA